MSELNIYKRLSNIQNELVVTKNQRNTFGNYNYRSAEDILEAAKPICRKNGLVLLVSDEVVVKGDRVYVEASARLYDFTGICIEVKASAREAQTQKGMNEAQITGSASSYARKYALGGLFNLDDNKDPDATNKHGKEEESVRLITQLQKDRIVNFVKEEKLDLTKVLTYYKVGSLDELNHLQAKQVIDKVNKK